MADSTPLGTGTDDKLAYLKHTHAWASALQESDLSCLSKLVKDGGEAILLGHGLERLYNADPQETTEKRQTHLLLTWIPSHKGLALNPTTVTSNDFCKEGRLYKTVHRDSGVTLTVREPGLAFEVELQDNHIESFIHKDRLQTTVLYFGRDHSLHHVTLRMHHGRAHTKNFHGSSCAQYSFPLNANLIPWKPHRMHLLAKE